MSDFYQTGVIATFHSLANRDLASLENELKGFAAYRKLALILPSLYSELRGNALPHIVDQLKDVGYVSNIIVSLDNANAAEFDHARRFFSVLPGNTRIVWNSGPRMREIYETIRASELPMGIPGKGLSVWMSYGYVISLNDIDAIALHDCDILTYNRNLLARLSYPVLNPMMDYDFCKGFYSRVTDRMHGRVTRLLVTPILRSLYKIIGHHPLVTFFDSFRYPLAGEFSMDAALARINRIPGDWGLEVGVLAEIYRNTAIRRVCQVDISDNYEHKHQELSPDDATKGLNKMSVDICKSLFRTLASEGVVFSEGFFKTLLATYVKTAQDMLKRYQDDAAINGLYFDLHSELVSIETFTHGIREAGKTIMDDPLGVPLIASWDRVISAVPDIIEKIHAAVEADNS